MAQNRSIERVISGNQTTDGAGVRLYRVFGHDLTTRLDPFLLLDDIHSSNPEDYLAGFPEHPHRGMETVTYMISGSITHRDNLGNKGVIRSGDVQWMTAGSGIIHQEMPQRYAGMLQGFQLWINLPSKDKMMPPRYREVPSGTIPKVKLAD
ncbi:MAG: pirin family protein, partial [Methanomassiliicoccales archaeon]|nr:pirin family protein [Methanomassiliicoccales archaeon]